MKSQNLSPVLPELEAARTLRERLLPIIFQVTLFPARQRQLNDPSPLGLIKLPPWLREGLETPQDIATPNGPEARFAMLLLRLGLEIADEYNMAHHARNAKPPHPKPSRPEAFDFFRTRLHTAIQEDDRMTAQRKMLLAAVDSAKLHQFRELCESADILLRAAAYEDARRRLSAGLNWAEVIDAEREEIVKDVLARLYKDTCRTFWGTPADDPEHPVPLRDDLGGDLLTALLRSEVGCIAYEGSGLHLPRNWWVVKIVRGAQELIHHTGHKGTNRTPPKNPYIKRITEKLIPRVDQTKTIPVEMLRASVFTIGSRQRIMGRVRAYSRKSGRDGAEGTPPDEWAMVNTTSRANRDHWGRAFSPMLMGPVPFYNGMKSRTLEAAWQFSKVYTERVISICTFHRAPRGPACREKGCKRFTPLIEPLDHVDADGMPNENWWRWARGGWQYEVDPDNPDSRMYLPYPMGGGARPAYSFWNGRRYSYIEARKEIYLPLYIEAATKLPAWSQLKGLYDAGERLKLLDVDGRNLHNLDMTYEQALNDPNYSFGHSLVLCALLEGVDLSALRVWNCNRLDKSAFWTSRLWERGWCPRPLSQDDLPPYHEEV